MRLGAAGGKGRFSANAPCIPARLGAFSQFAISNPLRLSRMALRLAPADLLTGLFIRAIHRMALISGPRQRRAGGIVVSSSRRPAAVILGSTQIHISRIQSNLGLNSYAFCCVEHFYVAFRKIIIILNRRLFELI